MTPAHLATWAIAAAATAGVVLRPFKWPEALWAVGGALLLIAAGLLPAASAAQAAASGLDVCLFLTGMMLLSEVAREEGLFDRAAHLAVQLARGSPRRLFALVYAVGAATTVLLSNDATAVVLTPAVYAAAKAARLEPLPFLFVCAFIANAASFMLPISNPANLVLYGDHPPALGAWLGAFALPSAAAIGATWAALRLSVGRRLPAACAAAAAAAPMSRGAWTALAGIAASGVVLLISSALAWPLGAPTCAMGWVTAIAVWAGRRGSPWLTLRGVSWQVPPLVLGLFAIVKALDRTGLIEALAGLLVRVGAASAGGAAWAAGASVALASNLANNLPVGLVASSVIAKAHPAQAVIDCALIGVDLGPNLSVTGSLATILWLIALRREGERVGFWSFLRLGIVATPPALLLALAARLLA